MPTLLLVDIHLPGKIDGIELAGMLKQERDVPLVFITGDRSRETFRRAKTLRPRGYVTKPIDPHQLWTTVELALSNLEAEQALARSANAHARITVFVSYSHEDVDYLDNLLVHLQTLPVERFEIWDDTRLIPGCDWRKELESKLVKARVAVMLVSQNFLASDFIMKYELPTLLTEAKEDGALVVYAIVRPCRIPPFLQRFKGINLPSRTISELRRPEKDRVWIALADLVVSLNPGAEEF